MFDLSGQRKEIIDADGHLLVMGGPGSGKTTIALLKAKQIIESGILRNEQRVLFLSFARVTIACVKQQAKSVLGDFDTSKIENTTYHSFIWTILKSHGYLLPPHCSFQLLLPYEASSVLSGFANDAERNQEKHRLLSEDGRLHFDLFAETCAELLSRSQSLRRLFSIAYPIIFLDEFQDTDTEQWRLIQLLGKSSTLIALADLEQRIYGFRGASPKRVSDFQDVFHPSTFDFGIENNRSNGTDIVAFGNDLLHGANIGKKYNNVCISHVESWKIKQFLKNKIYQHVAKLNQECNEWSLAVLVPSNSFMLTVSEYFSKEKIPHDVAVDTERPTVAAMVLAGLLDFASRGDCSQKLVVESLREHILGRNREGKALSKKDSELAQKLSDFLILGTKTREKRLLGECEQVSIDCNALQLTGDVATDWKQVRSTLKDKTHNALVNLLKDAMFIKLLRKGSALNSALGELWRKHGNYIGASEAVKNALTQEYFATSAKTWQGVNVMTIHKSKGKEFDVVIACEDRYAGRFISRNGEDEARLVLRVAATRAKKHVDIITPRDDPCLLL